jgi:hypothetical protein
MLLSMTCDLKKGAVRLLLYRCVKLRQAAQSVLARLLQSCWLDSNTLFALVLVGLGPERKLDGLSFDVVWRVDREGVPRPNNRAGRVPVFKLHKN